METKKNRIIGIISLFAIALTVITASFAYFQTVVGDPAVVDISVNAYTVDTFTFSTGEPISFSLDQENFASGKGNLSGSTTASAKLTANNKTNTATEHYYMYLNISENTYTYSVDENTPEIILTVTDSSGSLVSISGLTSVTAGGVTGYDITDKSGLITIFDNREITTTSSLEEKWTITLTFVNYNADQTANAGNSMTAEVIVQKEKIAFLADYITSLYTGVQGENNIYYHDSSLTNGAGDNSYRYAGASSSVNNYVCFGSDAETCPTENLYRIIGVIDGKVKLIKATSLGSMKWDSNNSNTWSTSSLNTYLNGTYLNTFSEDWQSKIATTTWKVGGIDDNIATVATIYTNELNNTSSGTDGLTEYSSKVALMYAHDYGFAASPTAWTTTLNNYDGNDSTGTSITTNDWLYLGSYEWLVSRISGYYSYSSFVTSSGRVTYDDDATTSYAVRPVLFLESTATYSGGIGTSSEPYHIG